MSQLLHVFNIRPRIDSGIAVRSAHAAHVERLLREVTHIQARAEPHASGIWSTGPGNHLEQRGFAGAVSSHDGPAFSAADCEIEPLVNHTWAVTLVQIFKDGHLFAGSRW